jgi:hypothetical protein
MYGAANKTVPEESCKKMALLSLTFVIVNEWMEPPNSS